MIERPGSDEFHPFYAGYVSLVPEENILSVLSRQGGELQKIVSRVPAEKESFRYAPDKWSVREVFGHMGDAERVFGYRALSISRFDRAPLPGFDEKDYVAQAKFGERTLEDLVSELRALRDANLALLRGLDELQWQNVGNANGSNVSVRAIAFIMAGHVRHHLGILRDRYNLDLEREPGL